MGRNDPPYAIAAKKQLSHLIDHVPRYYNGAISHRDDVAECWADFIYMVPPFIAFYGFAVMDATYLQTSVSQSLLYRDVLIDESRGLWRHVVGPKHADSGLWSTGNGWVLLGLTRVLGTLICDGKRRDESVWHKEKDDLTIAINEVLGHVVGIELENNLLPNYLDDPSWFGEVAGTAAIASAVFRLATLCPKKIGPQVLTWAEKSRRTIYDLIEEDGSFGPVCNAYSPKSAPLKATAESQAFVMLLFAAYRDWSRHKNE
jgi:rhamnogalacturonyl hydrolase YesR